MVQNSTSPLTITVSTGEKSNGIRNMSLTSPIKRNSLSNSPLGNRGSGGRIRTSSGGRYSSTTKDETTEEITSEFVSYTVQIPPTPDHQPMSSSQISISEDDPKRGKTQRSYISGTIFTGGFNSVTRGHVIENNDRNETAKSMGMACGMRGCDEEALFGLKMLCECGFRICRDCHLECSGKGGGHCPGCKEPIRDVSDKEDDEPKSEAEDQALPTPFFVCLCFKIATFMYRLLLLSPFLNV